MLKKNWNGIKFNELFFYEFDKCQLRASFMINKKLVRHQFSLEDKKIKPIKVKVYKAYGESFKYIILKKILFLAFFTIQNKGSIDLNFYKKRLVEIINNESKKNKIKIEKINKENLIQKGVDLYYKIDEEDLKNNIEGIKTVEINLKEYIDILKKRLKNHTLSVIPDFDFEKNFPYLEHSILAINYYEENQEIEIITTFIANIDEKFIHRNFLLKILFSYYFFIKKNSIEKEKNIKIKNINKIIAYFPLENKRKIFHFNDFKGTLSELDLFRIMKNYIQNNLSRTLNTINCEECENKAFCEVKTRSHNKKAIKNILKNNLSKEGGIKNMI